MNSDPFEDYAGEMINYRPTDSVVVMYNVSYHSRHIERTPTSSWRKQGVFEWLTNKCNVFQDNFIQKELLSIANINKHDLYEICWQKAVQPAIKEE